MMLIVCMRLRDPSVMQSQLYPVGDSEYFRGSIFNLKDIFGIVKCKIIAPDIYAPILLTQTSDGRIIAPVGSWTGWYCTEELKLAHKYGYQIEVLEGYHWKDSDIIFSDYVNKLYDLSRSGRLTYNKSDSRNFICKLLLNSLYGPLRDKFGMSPVVTEYSFYTKEEMEEDGIFSYKDLLNLGNYVMIGIESTKNSLKDLKHSKENKKKYNLLQISTLPSGADSYLHYCLR